MNRVEKGIAELTRSFDETLYPEEFLCEYSQLECLAHGHGTDLAPENRTSYNVRKEKEKD